MKEAEAHHDRRLSELAQLHLQTEHRRFAKVHLARARSCEWTPLSLLLFVRRISPT